MHEGGGGDVYSRPIDASRPAPLGRAVFVRCGSSSCRRVASRTTTKETGIAKDGRVARSSSTSMHPHIHAPIHRSCKTRGMRYMQGKVWRASTRPPRAIAEEHAPGRAGGPWPAPSRAAGGGGRPSRRREPRDPSLGGGRRPHNPETAASRRPGGATEHRPRHQQQQQDRARVTKQRRKELARW